MLAQPAPHAAADRREPFDGAAGDDRRARHRSASGAWSGCSPSWCWDSRALGHEVTVIARTCELPASAGVTFHRVRGPGAPVPARLSVVHARGLARGATAGAAASSRRPARSCSTASTSSPCTTVTRSGRPTRAARRSLFRVHVRAGGLAEARIGERLCFRANRAAAFVVRLRRRRRGGARALPRARRRAW